MKSFRNKILILLPFLFGGCTLNPFLPATEGEKRAAISYIPLDPLPVNPEQMKECTGSNIYLGSTKLSAAQFLTMLPDQTIRMAIAELNSDGEVSFTNSTVGAKSESYRIILDYMNSDTAPATFVVKREIVDVKPPVGARRQEAIYYLDRKDKPISIYQKVPEWVNTRYIIDTDTNKVKEDHNFVIVNLPVYVGLGLRMTANVTINKGNIALTGLPAIAAKASSGEINGSLVVQTLGITGKSVTAALPLPSELNQTTLQNALLSIGAMKATIYNDETIRTARIVGFDNLISGDSAFITAVRGALADGKYIWRQPCISEGLLNNLNH